MGALADCQIAEVAQTTGRTVLRIRRRLGIVPAIARAGETGLRLVVD